MSWKVRCAVSLLLTAVSLCAHAQNNTGLGKWFDKQIADRISISGWRRLGYHSRTVTGDKEAYDITEYSGQGLSSFTDLGQFRVTGTKVFDALNFDLNIQDSRFQDPQANRVSIDVAKGRWTVNLGDIRGSLASQNRFARFDKSLTGGQVGYRAKNFEARAVYSEVRGEPRTVSVQGNNSAGPYYLQSSQILRGSEEILVDGVKQEFGKDYTMDYDLGSVSFVNKQTFEGRIIPPTSTIVATYEVLGVNGSRGTVQGTSMSLQMGKSGRVGLTAMRQKQGGSARDSTYQQQFLGPIAAGSSLILRYEPQDPLKVRVFIGSVLQTLGAGYTFNAINKSILILLREVPSNTVLTVTYTPKPVNTVQGDRDVIGLDYRLPLNDRGSITYSHAIGRLSNSATPKSGTAQGIDWAYKTGNVEVVGSLQNVPEDYVSIETVGFERNQKTSRMGVHFTPSERFDYGLDYQNNSISTRNSNNSLNSSRFTQANGYVNFKPKAKGLPWQLTQTRLASNSTSNNTIVDTTTLGTSGRQGRSDWRLDLSNQFATGNATIDNVTSRRKLNLQTLAYRLNYQANKEITLDFNSSLSRVGTDGKSSLGRDLLLAANYRPSENLTLRAEVADSDAGQLATLGFINGSGLGYGGNGFSGGVDEAGFNSATNARTANLSASWTASDRFSLNGNITYYRTSGGVSSNTESMGFGIGANWSVNDYTDVDALFDTSTTSFLGSNLRSAASTLSLYLNSKPKGPWSFRGGINLLLTTGNSQFNQDSLGYEAVVNYRLARRHNLAFSADNGRLSGYLPQETRNMALTYQYQIWKSLAFNVGYRMIDVINRDASAVSGAYSSRGFDFELEFNFGR